MLFYHLDWAWHKEESSFQAFFWPVDIKVGLFGSHRQETYLIFSDSPSFQGMKAPINPCWKENMLFPVLKRDQLIVKFFKVKWHVTPWWSQHRAVTKGVDILDIFSPELWVLHRRGGARPSQKHWIEEVAGILKLGQRWHAAGPEVALVALIQACFLFRLRFLLLGCIFIPWADAEPMDWRSRQVVGNAMMLLHLEIYVASRFHSSISPAFQSSSLVRS